MKFLPSKLINQLAKLSRGLDETNPEFEKLPRHKLAKLLRSSIKKTWALQNERDAQNDLIGENHGLIQVACSELQKLSESVDFRGNPVLKNAYQCLHKAAINDEIHWGVTSPTIEVKPKADTYIHVDNIRDQILNMCVLSKDNPNLNPIQKDLDDLLRAMDDHTEQCIPVGSEVQNGNPMPDTDL